MSNFASFLPLKVWLRLSKLINKKNKYLLLSTIIATIIQGVFELIFVWQFSSLMNKVISSSGSDKLLFEKLYLVIFISIALFFARFITYGLNYYSISFTGITVGKNIMQTLFKSNLDSLNNYSEGELIARIGVKLDLVIAYIISPLVEISNAYILSLALVGALFFKLGNLMFLLISLLLIYKLLANKFINTKVSQLGSVASENLGKTTQLIKQTVRSFKELLIYKRAKVILKEYDLIMSKLWFANAKSSFLSILPRFTLELLALLPIFLLINVSLNKTDGDNSELITILILYAFVLSRLLPLYNLIIVNTATISRGIPYLADIEELIKNFNIDKKGFFSNEKFNKKLLGVFKNSKDYLIGDGISYIEMKEGNIVFITGESGIGKTSFVDRSLNLRGGYPKEIILRKKNFKEDFGNNVETKNLEKVSEISYMTQDTPISNGNLLDNLYLNEDNLSNLDYVDFVCRIFDINNIFDNRDNYLYSYIADNGNNLSGGQRKRIGLARAFLGSSKVVILDEPTSGLDDFNAMGLIKKIRKYFNKKAVVIITHNENLIDEKDIIYQVKRG